MLISEPYDASIHAPKDLTGLGHPCLRLPPTSCPWPRGPISALPQALSPALRNAGGDLLPELLFELSSWIDLAPGWWPCMSRWSLGCPLNPTPRDPSCVRLVSPLEIWCTGQIFVSRPHSHFGLSNGLTSEVPVN